jgi:hypothetical protein
MVCNLHSLPCERVQPESVREAKARALGVELQPRRRPDRGHMPEAKAPRRSGDQGTMSLQAALAVPVTLGGTSFGNGITIDTG